MELEGRQISEAELAEAVAADPGVVSRLGGEFLLSWNGCLARDRMGIIPGPIPPGTIVCSGTVTGTVDPPVPVLGLEEAISRAVSLRSTEGSVVALSGGVDSALVAGLARRPCIAVGVEGSHDLARASRPRHSSTSPATWSSSASRTSRRPSGPWSRSSPIPAL